MPTSEQSIRVTAKGEFTQLQRGLKDLQGDLKNVLGEIDKGARKGGIFDDSSVRALDTFNKRFKDSMEDLNGQFKKQNDLIDTLYDKMKKGDMIEKVAIGEQIKSREKELDVIRKQIYEVERLHKKRTDEARSYEIKPPGSSSSSSSGSSEGLVNMALGGLSKITGVVGTIAKFGAGLAGITSIMSMAQQAYQIAYQREVGSLDTAQRIRGYGYGGSAVDMYNQSANIGRRDNMGYSEAESWSFLDSYSSRGGRINPWEQYGMQKFARGYGLDLNTVGSMAGTAKQLGGITNPKQFADMIAGSVSNSGMLPRILEVMQAHTNLLQSINTTFKDGSSSQILAYQTTLDRLGNQNGMTKLTGEQGTNIINGLNGIFQPNNDKWLWTGISALQQYNPKKYGSMGLYDLQENFEDGLNNSDNLPAMAEYLKKSSGGNNNVFKRLMQSWLQDGGFNATKRQVDELDQVTNGFTAFDKTQIDSIMKSNASTDSGAKYSSERQGESGQQLLALDANFEKNLGDFGENYILPAVKDIKTDFSHLLDAINGEKGLPGILDVLKNLSPTVKSILGAVIALGAINTLANVGGLISKFRGKGGGGSPIEEELGEGATGKAKPTEEPLIGKDLKAGALSEEEASKIGELSKGGKASQGLLERVYRSTGDMDAVEAVAKGADPADVIDMLSNGDVNLQKQLADHYSKTGSLDSTASKAEDLLKASEAKGGSGLLSKIGKVGQIGGKFLKKVPILGGLLDFGLNMYQGNGLGRSASSAGGMVLGGAGGELGGSAIGGLIGGGIGALFGGVGAVPGAMIGSGIGGFVGSLGGGMLGDHFGGKAYDYITGETAKKTSEATDKLMVFANKGQLDIDGLSQIGIAKLDEMKEKGLINFTDMKTSSTTTLTNMSTEGKQNLLKLQQEGLISIGGLQKDGTTKITALNDEGKKALTSLQSTGEIALTDFQKTGKLQITSLSEDGAKQLLDLQKNGSLSLTSMSEDTSSKLKDIREDTGSKMDDIVTEHKGFVDSMKSIFSGIGDFFSGIGGKVVDWFTGLTGGNKNTSSTNDGGAYNGNGQYNGKYANWINDASKQNGLDPFLVAGIIKTESNFNPNAVNPSSGATGLGQFLASTARDEGLTDRTDPQSSIYALAKYLKKRISWAGGDVNKGIMGYGEGTTAYLNKVLQNMQYEQTHDSAPSANTSAQVSGGFGGGNLGDSDIGHFGSSSFFSDWQDKVTSPFRDFRGYNSDGTENLHHGLDLMAKQGTSLDALAGGKISFLNMDDGGQYDQDGKANSREGGTELGVTMANGQTYFYSHLSDINPEILKQWQSGNRNIGVNAGDYLANSGGAVGALGSGYGSEGEHLHLGLMDSDGTLEDPTALLNRANGNGVGSTQNLRVTVDVNLKGEAVGQLNNMTLAQLKSLIEQTMTAITRQKLSMNSAIRG